MDSPSHQGRPIPSNPPQGDDPQWKEDKSPSSRSRSPQRSSLARGTATVSPVRVASTGLTRGLENSSFYDPPKGRKMIGSASRRSQLSTSTNIQDRGRGERKTEPEPALPAAKTAPRAELYAIQKGNAVARSLFQNMGPSRYLANHVDKSRPISINQESFWSPKKPKAPVPVVAAQSKCKVSEITDNPTHEKLPLPEQELQPPATKPTEPRQSPQEPTRSERTQPTETRQSHEDPTQAEKPKQGPTPPGASPADKAASAAADGVREPMTAYSAEEEQRKTDARPLCDTPPLYHLFSEEQPLPGRDFSGVVKLPWTRQNRLIEVYVNKGQFWPCDNQVVERIFIFQFPRSFVQCVLQQGRDTNNTGPFFVIQSGSRLGVVADWSETQKHVIGVSGAIHAKKRSWAEVRSYINTIGKIHSAKAEYGQTFIWSELNTATESGSDHN